MGTIKYISKTITENAESIKWFATNGNINFNATKVVMLQSRDKIKYDRYEPVVDSKDEDFNITFSLNKNEATIVPLGILDFNNEYENPYFAFDYSLSMTDIDALEFQIKDADGNVIYQLSNLAPVVVTASKVPHIKNEIKNLLPAYAVKTLDFRTILEQFSLAPPDYTKIGSYVLYWDGFDNDEVYDSTRFNNKKLNAKITAIKVGKRKSLEVEFSTHYEQVDWVDVKIDRKKNKIDTTLRVNLQDGGAKGLECWQNTRNFNPPHTKSEFCDWDKIPEAAIQNAGGKEPLKTRTKSFSDLEKLAIAGINYHWSRIKKVGFQINNEKYQVVTSSVNTKDNSLNTLSLIYNTNNIWGRSGNAGILGKIYYNIGYCNFSEWHQFSSSNEWEYLDLFKDKIDEDFMYTCAHELGHSILKAYGNIWHSFTHDNSSEIWQTPNGNKSYEKEKSSNEINLMHYFKDDPYQSHYDYTLIKASKEDVLGLIWLSKIKINNS